VSAENQNQLTYYCRYCGNKDETITEEGVCVLNTQFKKGEQKFNHIINEYTKLDPTLPRIFNMKCPNAECKTNHDGYDKPVEVIYMRYDDDNLKYLYICAECDTTWKSGEA
jgi:aspartate carbamoyltransferase regulatory subunit